MSIQTIRRLCVYLTEKPLVRHTSAFRYHMILREVFLLNTLYAGPSGTLITLFC